MLVQFFFPSCRLDRRNEFGRKAITRARDLKAWQSGDPRTFPGSEVPQTETLRGQRDLPTSRIHSKERLAAEVDSVELFPTCWKCDSNQLVCILGRLCAWKFASC